MTPDPSAGSPNARQRTLKGAGMTDLDKLIDAVDEGDDVAVADLCRDIYKDARGAGVSWPVHEARRAYNGSLDAAKALHETLLPGWFPGMSKNIHHGNWYAWVQDKATAHFSAVEPDPARAWLIAIMKAYRDQSQ